MIKLTPFRVKPSVFYELVVAPQFGDFQDGEVRIPSDEEGDWALIDSPKSKVAIIDIFTSKNVLKRRDATCKLIYTPVARMTPRYIEDEALYAATEDCQAELYHGCMEDYLNDKRLFGQKVMPILEKGVAEDIYVNKYFGDVSRSSDVNGTWNWNKFKGVWTAYTEYAAAGVVDNPTALPSGDITPAAAYNALAAMYADQPAEMDNMDDDDKAFYVSKSVYNAYGQWLITAGGATFSLAELQARRAKLYFNGVELRVKRWDGALAALNSGTKAHAIILTLKGNFAFKTDSTYGGGPYGDQAVRVWWSDDDNVWKYQIHLKGGAEIIAPQFSVLAITSF